MKDDLFMYILFISLAVPFGCSNPETESEFKPSGSYEIITDWNHEFTELSCLLKEDNHSVMELEFLEDGTYKVYNVFNYSRNEEYYWDYVPYNKWTMKGDTLVLLGLPKGSGNLIYIKELNCYSTSDLSLLLRKN